MLVLNVMGHVRAHASCTRLVGPNATSHCWPQALYWEHTARRFEATGCTLEWCLLRFFCRMEMRASCVGTPTSACTVNLPTRSHQSCSQQ